MYHGTSPAMFNLTFVNNYIIGLKKVNFLIFFFFPQSFVTCSIGIWNVGLVTLPFGLVNAIVSYFSGYVIKYVGRLPVFIAGNIYF